MTMFVIRQKNDILNNVIMKSIEHDYNHNQQMIHQMMVNSYYLKLLHSYIMEDKNKQNTVLGMDYPNMIKEEYYLKKVDFPIVQVDISTCQEQKKELTFTSFSPKLRQPLKRIHHTNSFLLREVYCLTLMMISMKTGNHTYLHNQTTYYK